MSFLTGLLAGAISWWLAGVLSGRFEPYDSTRGMLITQLVLCGVFVWTGYRVGLKSLFLCLPGAWLGLNLISYTLGGSESRAWVLLGAMTSLLLLALPLIAGLVASMVRYLRRRKSNSPSR